MIPLLVFRERVKNFYQRYDIYLRPVIKFLFALIAFTTINREIGYDARLESLPVVLGLSLISAITPSAIMVLLAAGVSVLHVFSISPILSIIILIILMILYFLFARFTPNLGYVLLAVPILYYLKIPYTIPLLLGMIATPVAIIPTTCGVIIYYVFQIIKSAVTMQVNTSVDEIFSLYTYVIDSLRNNRSMIMAITIFALILLAVYFVRKIKLDYAFEISIAVGALTSILGFLVSYLILDKSEQILSMILGTIASAAIAYIVQFFELTLDYSGVEHVQFEDDAYYYYVKVVPKATVTAPQMKVKHINKKSSETESSRYGYHRHDIDPDEEYDDEDDGYSDPNDDYGFDNEKDK